MAPQIPPFPSGLRETRLQRFALSALLNRDSEAEDRVLEACKSQGFFLLDLTETEKGRSLLSIVDHLYNLSEEAFSLPREEKAKIGFDKTASLFGWKANGILDSTDKFKRRDVGQFFNISKDDILKNPGRQDIAYPSPLKEEVEDKDAFQKFVKEAHGIGLLILECLERKLGLAPGLLTSRHRIGELAGDHIRLTYGPGDPDATGASGKDEGSTRITTTGHTDFGSITILFNSLGGLQIENRDVGGWEWVRPDPGCVGRCFDTAAENTLTDRQAIINLGDAAVEFGGQQLRSGKHRVVAAPGEQAKLDRYSVVYFVRPEDDVVLENLSDLQSGASKHFEGKRWKAGDWIIQRSKQLGNRISSSQTS